MHVLPDFGDYPLPAITRAGVKAFIARKSKQQRASRSLRNPNPNRPALSPKSIRNMVATLSAVLESAVVDYELLPSNALRGVLRRKNFPTDARRLKDERPRVLNRTTSSTRWNSSTLLSCRWRWSQPWPGLRWGEQVSLRIDEDVDLRRNKLRITRALYKRIPQTLKTKQSLRDVDMGPIVRRIMRSVPWTDGLVFSPDGAAPIGEGSWIKRQWRKAQVRAGIRRPIRWHDLRHQFVSLLIAAGKSPKYIAEQAGHASAGFTLDRYGHLFKTITPTPGEVPEDLLWPSGSEGVVGRIWHHIGTVLATKSRSTAGEHAFPPLRKAK